MLKLSSKEIKNVRNGGDWDLWFPDIKHPEYDKLWKGDFDAWEAAGLPKVIYQTIKARELWDKLIQNTYTRNEPGILFIDNAEKNNNLTRYMKVTGVNPCGEILMCADPGIVEIDGVIYEYLGDICNLGAINLTQFFTIENGFAWDAFKESVAVLVRALDNVIDISGYPLEKIKNAAMLRRKIGCGVMGYGSLLFMMGFKYGSQKANEFTEVLMKEYANAAYQASAMLAKEKGAFPLWKPEMINDGYIGNSGMLTDETLDLIAAHGLRNAQLMTIAPTGTTSIFAGLVSGGVEPVFEKEYTRWVISNHRAEELLEGLDAPDYRNGQFVETKDFKFSMAGDEKVLVSLDGTLMIDQNHGLRKKEICEDYGWYWAKKHRDPDAVTFAKRLGIYKTAMELSVKEHMDAFKVMSKAVDMSISKCVDVETTMVEIDGKIVYLDELEYGEEDSFVQMSGMIKNHNHIDVPIKATYNNGITDVVEITFSDRSSIICTPNHRLYTENGFEPAIEILVGTKIV